MTSSTTSYLRLCRIDELTLTQHSFLSPEDEIYFLREYTPRESFSYSATNQLIHNLKKPLERKEAPEWRHKEQAIVTAGLQLKTALLQSKGLRERLVLATLVPIPPSAAKNSPKYDDRITQMLQVLGAETKLDIRELVIQTISKDPVHLGKSKREPTELLKDYQLDTNLSDPPPQELWIFDDILTSGSHFKATQLLLKNHFPNTPTVGFFLARTVGKPPP